MAATRILIVDDDVGMTDLLKLHLRRDGLEIETAADAVIAFKSIMLGVFSTFTVNVPQLDADIDRVKAKAQGVPLQNLFETMQIYLGSLYVNDFNTLGRTYQVVAQADREFRAKPEDILRLQTRNDAGKMVPLGSVLRLSETTGPETAMRYNGFRAADVNGAAAPGYSSGQAQEAMARLLDQTLPKGMTFLPDRLPDGGTLINRRVATFDVGSLAPGESVMLRYPARANATGRLCNNAIVRAGGGFASARGRACVRISGAVAPPVVTG